MGVRTTGPRANVCTSCTRMQRCAATSTRKPCGRYVLRSCQTAVCVEPGMVARAHSCRRVSTLQMAGTVAATRAWGTLVRTAGVHAHGYNDSRGGAAIAVCTSVRAAGPRLREGRAGQLGEVA